MEEEHDTLETPEPLRYCEHFLISEYLSLIEESSTKILSDQYGQLRQSHRPVSIYRVKEGTRFRSRAKLFQLPVEILEEIVQYIPQSSLAKFALVNWDCCQIARSRQFATVVLDYSTSAFALLSALLQEALQRANNDNRKTKLPAIGACIRYLKIATDRAWVEHRHSLDLDILHYLDNSETRDYFQKAARSYYSVYLDTLSKIIPIALPHLESFEMLDRVSLPSDLLKAFAQSPMRSLRLARVPWCETSNLYRNTLAHWKSARFSLHRGMNGLGWPLEHLDLQMGKILTFEQLNRVLEVIHNILRLCAPTLKRLSLQDSGFHKDLDTACFPDSSLPVFESLRELRLSCLHFGDTSILKSLFPSDTACQLNTLAIEFSPWACEYLSKYGEMSSLKTLTWSSSGAIPHRPPAPRFQDPLLRMETSLEVLKANQHVAKLSISQWDFPAGHLDTHVIPLLSDRFFRLTSLSVDWGKEQQNIPELSLNLIAQLETLEQLQLGAGVLETLEQLRLGAGVSMGVRCTWLIDHEIMRQSLSPLIRLKRLAFIKETYDLVGQGPREYEQYYTSHILEETAAAMRMLNNNQVETNNDLSDDIDGETEQTDDDLNDDTQYETTVEHRPDVSDVSNQGEEGTIEAESMHEETESDSEDEDIQQDEEMRDVEEEARTGPTEEEIDDFFANMERRWEIEHAARMLSEANAYFALLPNLEWIYVGQFPMTCHAITRMAKLDSPKRISCDTHLRTMFGWPHKY
jgi:hypothetical protein